MDTMPHGRHADARPDRRRVRPGDRPVPHGTATPAHRTQREDCALSWCAASSLLIVAAVFHARQSLFLAVAGARRLAGDARACSRRWPRSPSAAAFSSSVVIAALVAARALSAKALAPRRYVGSVESRQPTHDQGSDLMTFEPRFGGVRELRADRAAGASDRRDRSPARQPAAQTTSRRKPCTMSMATGPPPMNAIGGATRDNPVPVALIGAGLGDAARARTPGRASIACGIDPACYHGRRARRQQPAQPDPHPAAPFWRGRCGVGRRLGRIRVVTHGNGRRSRLAAVRALCLKAVARMR